MLVVMPVLLLLLLAAADMGKLFVISGKSEIGARYVALSHFRGFPFGDAYPGQQAGQEIEGLYFDDALDDNVGADSDDPDVTYKELGNEDLPEPYAPGEFDEDMIDTLWEIVNTELGVLPVRGARSTFTYNLPAFPYGRDHPMEDSKALPGDAPEGMLAASYDATGNFVMLADAFAGSGIESSGEQVRLALLAYDMLIGTQLSLGALPAILLVMWAIFLP
jgi:hypothetical protein